MFYILRGFEANEPVGSGLETFYIFKITNFFQIC